MSPVHSSVIDFLGKVTFAQARHGEDILHADIDLDCMHGAIVAAKLGKVKGAVRSENLVMK